MAQQENQEQLVLGNLNLIHSIIKTCIGINADDINRYEDYFQEGCLALIKAVKSFDETKNVLFSTYAYHTIKGHLQTYKMNYDITKGIKYPPSKLRSKYCKYLDLKNSNTPTDEICKQLNISNIDALMFDTIGNAVSLDVSVSNDENGITMSELIIDSSIDIENDLIEHENECILFNIIRDVLNECSDVQRNVYIDYLNNYLGTHKLSRNELAAKHHISTNYTKFTITKINKKIQRSLLIEGYFEG